MGGEERKGEEGRGNAQAKRLRGAWEEPLQWGGLCSEGQSRGWHSKCMRAKRKGKGQAHSQVKAQGAKQFPQPSTASGARRGGTAPISVGPRRMQEGGRKRGRWWWTKVPNHRLLHPTS